MEGLTERVLVRFLDDEEPPAPEVVDEYVRTITDRLALRIGGEPPAEAGSIVVEACMKSLRLRGFEGSSSESAGNGGSISASFVDGVLNEYEPDIAALARRANSGVRFF